MSSNNSGSVDYSALVDQYSDEASVEAIEAVEAVHKTVDTAAEAGEQVVDVGFEVFEIVNALGVGDRMASVQAALDLFDDETGKEVEEAQDSLMRVYEDGEAAFDEIRDLADVLSDAAHDVVDGVERIELPVGYFDDR